MFRPSYITRRRDFDSLCFVLKDKGEERPFLKGVDTLEKSVL